MGMYFMHIGIFVPFLYLCRSDGGNGGAIGYAFISGQQGPRKHREDMEMANDVTLRTLPSEAMADLIDGTTVGARQIRLTAKVVKDAERMARASELARRASVAYQMRSDITENEQTFAIGNLRDYWELGCVVNGIVRDGHAKGARGVAIGAEHTPEEWRAMQEDAKANGTKAQPRRLSVYTRASRIHELADSSDLANTIESFVSVSDGKYSPADFIAWLQNKPRVETTPSDRFASACRSAVKNGLTRDEMLAMVASVWA